MMNDSHGRFQRGQTISDCMRYDVICVITDYIICGKAVILVQFIYFKLIKSFELHKIIPLSKCIIIVELI